MKLNRILATALTLILGLVLTAGSVQAAAKPAPAGKMNINTATAEQLETLPGVGPKLAVRIVEYRQKAGAFKSTQELMNVKGVGEKSFSKIEAYLTVGDAPRGGASR